MFKSYNFRDFGGIRSCIEFAAICISFSMASDMLQLFAKQAELFLYSINS
jgi:hypothetical protein